MRRTNFVVLRCCAAFSARVGRQARTCELLLEDFEAAPQGWNYVSGHQFPGAKGSLVRDPSVAHGVTNRTTAVP